MINMMIVDDDQNYRYAMHQIIDWHKYGFNIVADAIHGQHALMMLKEIPVDFIITDISMPKMNGIELIKEISRDYRDIIIIALSAYDDFAFVKDALKSGAQDYILKYDLNENNVLSVLEEAKKELTEKEHYEGIASTVLARNNCRNEVKRAIKFMEENFKTKIILSEIANYVNLSPNHLCKIFREETGFNIVNFINNIRVEHAKSLVNETNLLNYEIAKEVGFENPTYLCKVFKKITGESIHEYKRHG